MSNWPLNQSTRFETLGVTTGQGTAIVAGGSNVKGAYATIGTTSFAYDGFFLNVEEVTLGAVTRLDIAIHDTADQIVVQDLAADYTTASNDSAGPKVWIPVAVPSGATIKARVQWQFASTSTAFNLSIIGCAGSSELSKGYRALLSATDWTNSSPSNSVTPSGTTLSAWGTVTASTSARFSGLYICQHAGAVTGRTQCYTAYNIGKGSAGNEVAIISGVTGAWISSGVATACGLPRGPFFCDIPAGTRLAFQLQNSGTSNIASFCSLSGLVA